MEDDGYWKDLEEAYLDCKRMGVTFHSDDELWELAKKMVQVKYENVKAVERAIREGRPINADSDVIGHLFQSISDSVPE